MAFVTVTYSFTNGTAADAGQVNTNFSDLIAGTSDGTKDLNVAAITGAGTATFNGNVLLGNASGDDVQFNGSLATSIPIKTTNTYDVGSATRGLAGIYIADGGTHTIRIVGSSSGTPATWTLTLPSTAGSNGQVLQNSGSGTMAWAPGQTALSAKSADYTVTDTDGAKVIYVTTGSTDRTITLPTLADNLDREITIKKADSGTGKVILDGEGSENIEGATTYTLYVQYDSVTIKATSTEWIFIHKALVVGSQVRADTGVAATASTNTKIARFTNFVTVGTGITAADSATAGTSFTINHPGVYTVAFYHTQTASGARDHAISINSSSLTTNPNALTASERLCMVTSLGGQSPAGAVASVRLAAGDVLRPHVSDTAGWSTASYVNFIVTQVARY